MQATQPQALQAPQSPMVTIAINVDELNVILAGLGELQHKQVIRLEQSLIAQAQSQLNGAPDSGGDSDKKD